jgi:hypothetical protein
MDRFVWTIIAALVILSTVIVLWGWHRHTTFAEACEKSGGVPFQPRGAQICLDRSMVVRP